MKQPKGFASVERDRLMADLSRYAQGLSKGEDVGELHQVLLGEISAQQGPAAAHFFDRYQMLPYEHVGGVLWPMTPDEAHRATLLRIVAMVLVFIGCGAALMSVGQRLAVGVGLIASVAAYCAFPRVYRWPCFIPDDLKARVGRVEEYRRMVIDERIR